MVPTSTKSKGKRIHDGSAAAFPQRNINNFQIVCSSDEEPMSESSNHAATSSHGKKEHNLPSIDDKFQFLRKGKTKRGKETHIFKCLITNCGSVIKNNFFYIKLNHFNF